MDYIKGVVFRFVIVLGMGFALGYYVRGNQHEIKTAALEKTRRVGVKLKQKAIGSKDSVEEAAREVVGLGKPIEIVEPIEADLMAEDVEQYDDDEAEENLR